MNNFDTTNFTFASIVENFHFLRPEWFIALIPAILLFAIIKFRQGKGSNWENNIDASLLPFLIDDPKGKNSRKPFFLILLAWGLTVLALAGPVWQKTPQPVHERADALVIIFDLTRSMYATDVKPNRLVRAKRKLIDLLSRRDEGVTALIVYAGDAHTVTPLTDDTKTISEMIPVIAPEIMPAPGSKLAPALTLAESLFKDAGMASGRILIITDEIRDIAQAQSIARQYRVAYPISVMAVGTRDGAPIDATTLVQQGGYLKTSSGALVIPKVNFSALEDFASVAGGRFSQMTLLDNDLDFLLAEQPLLDNTAFREVERDFDIWFEEGPWILLLLLPIAALSFRRGWIWSLFFVIFLPAPEADASLWDDLWLTKDQQAAAALDQGDAATAAALFKNNQWKGAAQYKSDDFAGAQSAFEQTNNSDSRFNLGNALAKQGEYEPAIAAYEEALTINPDNEDAAFNKEMIEKLLEQKQQEEQEKQEKNKEDSENSEDKPNESQDNQDQKNQDQDSEDQQQSDQEKQDKEAKEKEAKEQKEAKEKDEAEQEQEAKDQQMAEAEKEPLNEEEQQALEQWLRRVPDDPGGLLRRKFKMQYDNTRQQDPKAANDSSNW